MFKYTLFSLVISIAVSLNAHAEGSDTLGNEQVLQAGTVMGIDILSVGEEIFWVGTGDLELRSPQGNVQTIASGNAFISDEVGTYSATNLVAQTNQGWDIRVGNEVGRLFSLNWQFNASSFAADFATNASFYALVETGVNTSKVIELRLAGLAGFVYTINANAEGVSGENGGRSVFMAGNVSNPRYKIYLAPPEVATYSSASPEVSAFTFRFGESEALASGASLACTTFASATQYNAFFDVETNVAGTMHIQCDIDGDGEFARADSPDVLVVSEVVAGQNSIEWNALNGRGEAINPGAYDCVAELHLGEFHYVGADIETSYPGFQLYEVLADQSTSGLPMYWDDSIIQANAQAMPNGELGLENSGPSGIRAISGEAIVPNVNARSWGNFNSGGKGNTTFIDTYTWLDASLAQTLIVEAVDGTTDTDGDGLSDLAERCVYGTSPENPDTDDDGVDDGTQWGGSESSSSGGAGLESNADRMQALAQRAINQAHGDESDELPLAQNRPLLTIAPQSLGLNTRRIEMTKTDLVAHTNAIDTAAFDYLDAAGKKIGGVFLAETEGEHYEHTKVICDRAAGKSLSHVTQAQRGDRAYLLATLKDAISTDHTATLVLLDEGPHYLGASGLVHEHFPRASAGQRIIQLQAWSGVVGQELRLLEQSLSRLDKPVRWTNNNANAPQAYFSKAATLGGRVEVAVSGNLRGHNLSALTYDSAGNESELLLERNLSAHAIAKILSPFRDVALVLRKDGAISDRVWLSDGTYIQVGDNHEGFSLEQSQVQALERTSARLALYGAAKSRAQEQGALTIARHVRGDIDLSLFESMRVHASENDALDICFESLIEESFACAKTENGLLRLGALKQTHRDVLKSVSLILVTRNANEGEVFHLEGIDFSTTSDDEALGLRPVSEANASCSSMGTHNALSGFAIWLGFVAYMRRRRA